jgi:hypothetical protein
LGDPGERGWSSRPSEEGVARPALRWCRAPEGGWCQRSPGGLRPLRGKPRFVRFPPGVVFPKKGERSHRVDSTRRERPPGGRAEARLSGPRVSPSSAEAPLVRLRVSCRPLERRSAVGASARAPPRTARACRSVRGRPLRPCRCSVVPEGQLDPRVAPKRGVGPTPSRGTEVLRASWCRRSGSWKARSWLPRTAAPRKALRRSAPSSLSLCGPKPGRGGLTVRKRTGGGRVRSSLDRAANRAGMEKRSFPPVGARRSDAPVGGSWNQT